MTKKEKDEFITKITEVANDLFRQMHPKDKEYTWLVIPEKVVTEPYVLTDRRKAQLKRIAKNLT